MPSNEESEPLLKKCNIFTRYDVEPQRHSSRTIAKDQQIVLSWSQLNAIFEFRTKSRCRRNNKESKLILKNVCGVAYPNEILAIMGSSGAGKSTLLNSITFRTDHQIKVTGSIYANGVPTDQAMLASCSAYVQQNELFINSLTVHEHLLFQARLRMPRATNQDVMKRVNEVILELSLTKCRKTIIGNPEKSEKSLSGGERKRLSFASEILTNPVIMFCDEPTSGLDSYMAQSVVEILKNLARSGKTVVLTLHQPSSEVFALFDKLILMAEGQLAFSGTLDEAADFFKRIGSPVLSNYNPADYYIQLLAIVPNREEICRTNVKYICGAFADSDKGKALAARAAQRSEQKSQPTVHPYHATWWTQLKALIWRSWRSAMQEPRIVQLGILQAVCVALLVGITYYDQKYDADGVMNINGVLFIFITNMTFQAMFNVMHVFCEELPVFLKENHDRLYRVDTYFLCKTIAELPFDTAKPIVFVSVCYHMVGLNSNIGCFLMCLLILILISNAAVAFGYAVAAMSLKLDIALTAGPPCIVPLIIFGGFLLNINSIPVYFEWLSYMSWFRHGYEALVINQWKNVKTIDCPPGTPCPRNGTMIIESFNFGEDNIYVSLAWLAGLVLFYRAVAFMFILLRSYRI